MLLDGCHSAGDGGDSGGGDVVAQKFHLRHSKDTLLLVDDQSSCLEPLEEGPQVPPVLGGGAAPDDDIIQVDEYEVQPDRSRSICRWKVFPALRRPKVICRNSNSPKGVAMAVFSMSPGCIRI